MAGSIHKSHIPSDRSLTSQSMKHGEVTANPRLCITRSLFNAHQEQDFNFSTRANTLHAYMYTSNYMYDPAV